MNSILSAVSLRRLRVFLCVCETLHMARAAERLGVAQPALSQQIAALEEAIGAKLLQRYGRGIELTTAGHACRSEAQKLLALHQNVIEQVRRTARGDIGIIALGYVGSSMFTDEFPAQLKEMRENAPEVEFILREGGIAIQLAGLEDGDLDVALVRAPVVVNPPLRYRLHSRQDLVVILPGDHQLAELPEIPLKKLSSESMIGFSDTDDVGIGSIVAQLAKRAGCKLEVKWRVTEIGSILGLVAAGLGYGIVPKDVALYTNHRIIMRPLAELGASTELWLVWNEQKETPALRRFLDIAVPPTNPDE